MELRIFITGISGTVGRAFTKYLLDEGHHVLGIDRNEENVAKFKRDYPEVDVQVGDFGDVSFINGGIDILVHSAAMKHVDLCEANPNECTLNNVVKTYNLFKTAYDNNVRILFISTDKSVEPISVYGFSKAIGEMLALERGGSFIRSGNIVASSGSVLNIWDEAIKNKQPLKITHKDMKRYFISPESLVEQSWPLFMDGQQAIIPKMDREIYLIELAEEKLNKYGYTLDNYPHGVEYIGLRLGEKLEELLEWPSK